MKQVETIALEELQEMAQKMYGDLVKADVDVVKGIMLVDMEMHADGEAYLLENGSKQRDLWGINLHPAKFGSDGFVEFDSMINLKPSQGNTSKDVLDVGVRRMILDIVNEVVHE